MSMQSLNDSTEYFLVDDVCVQYGSSQVVNGLSFSLKQGEIGCLLGYSGCGKTTALRAIAGLEPISRGRILLNQQCLSQKQENRSVAVKPARRHMGMVFQDYALFEHLNVEKNIGFGLHDWSAGERKQRIEEMLSLIGLEDIAKRRLHQLSGGQQQRVALARALAPKPKLLLLDEPFSNLDVVLRESLAMNVRDILKQTNTTAILVTHDQNEAFALADKIGVMHQGQLAQWSSANDLYRKPNNPFVANFIGEGALLDGVVSQLGIITAMGEFLFADIHSSATVYQQGQAFQVLLRPEFVKIVEKATGEQEPSSHHRLPLQKATIINHVFRGNSRLYHLRLDDGQVILAKADGYEDYPLNALVNCTVSLKQGGLLPVFAKS